jgi:hypothetical protein
MRAYRKSSFKYKSYEIPRIVKREIKWPAAYLRKYLEADLGE